MVRKYAASLPVDMGLIPLSNHIKSLLKMAFTSFQLDAQRKKDSTEYKPTSSLIISVGKAFNWIPLASFGRQRWCRAVYLSRKLSMTKN